VSAVNPEQFQQLPMFMRAGDLRSEDEGKVYHHGGEVDYDDVYMHDMWTRKAQEANAPGSADRAHPDPYNPRASRFATPQPGSLTEHVAQHGVREPVGLEFEPAAYPDELDADEVDRNGLLRRPTVKDGYHRVAAANAVSPDTLVPVHHGWGWY